MLDHLQDGREDVELLGDLLADAYEGVRGIEGADLLGVAEIVDSFDAGQQIREATPAPLATLVGRDVDRLLAGFGLVHERFRLVEETELLA